MNILKIPQYIVLGLIKFYQKFLSLDQAFWSKWVGIKVCIYHPTCSQYTYDAIKKFGIIKGFYLGGNRILRCNPYSKGGDDPVPETFTWKRVKP